MTSDPDRQSPQRTLAAGPIYAMSDRARLTQMRRDAADAARTAAEARASLEAWRECVPADGLEAAQRDWWLAALPWEISHHEALAEHWTRRADAREASLTAETSRPPTTTVLSLDAMREAAGAPVDERRPPGLQAGSRPA